MAEYLTTVFRGEADEPVAISVRYDYNPPHRGARDSLMGKRGAGAPLEPDESASVDLYEATTEDGGEIELTDSEREKITEEILANP